MGIIVNKFTSNNIKISNGISYSYWSSNIIYDDNFNILKEFSIGVIIFSVDKNFLYYFDNNNGNFVKYDIIEETSEIIYTTSERITTNTQTVNAGINNGSFYYHSDLDLILYSRMDRNTVVVSVASKERLYMTNTYGTSTTANYRRIFGYLCKGEYGYSFHDGGITCFNILTRQIYFRRADSYHGFSGFLDGDYLYIVWGYSANASDRIRLSKINRFTNQVIWNTVNFDQVNTRWIYQCIKISGNKILTNQRLSRRFRVFDMETGALITNIPSGTDMTNLIKLVNNYVYINGEIFDTSLNLIKNLDVSIVGSKYNKTVL